MCQKQMNPIIQFRGKLMTNFILHSIKTRYPMLLVVTAFYIIALVTYGLVPNFYVNDLSSTFLMTANTQSLHNHGIFNLSYSNNFGMNLGYPFLMGLPFIYLTAVLQSVTHLDSYSLNIVIGALVLLAGFIFLSKLLIRLGSNKYIAVFMGFIYLMSYINYGQNTYHYMMYAFILLPCYLYVDIVLLDKIFSSGKLPFLFILIFASVKVLSIFMDGYSFTMSALASAVLLSSYICKNITKKSKVLIAAVSFSLSYLVAVFLYKKYVPFSAAYSNMPIDFFRAQGVDIISLFTPGDDLFLTNIIGIGKSWNAAAFYGDSSNVKYNYLGYSLVALTFYSIVIYKTWSHQIKAIAIAGTIAFVLSLGPSLKVNVHKDVQQNQIFTFDDYLLQKADTTLNLHTDFLYEKIPGIKNMRAVHRWLLLFKLFLVVAAAISITYLLNRKRYVLVVIIVGFIGLELAPDFPSLHNRYKSYLGEMRLFNNTALSEITREVSSGEKIFFISNENDFLSNYLSAHINAKSYNCGGDKNQELSKNSWPESITNMANYNAINDNAYLSLANGIVDVIILPHFSLRWDSYHWPPSKRVAVDEELISHINFKDPRLIYKRGEWFTFLTLNPNQLDNQ